MPRTRRRLLGLVGTGLAAGLAGCGGTGGSSDDGDDDADEDDTDESTESDDERSGGGGGDGEGGGGGIVGLGESVDESVPRVAFQFEYDASATAEDGTGVLTVAHGGGDPVVAVLLSVTGDGIVDPAGVTPDVTSGDVRWSEAGGETSDETAGESAVGPGDELTVGVQADYDVRLVWSHPDRDTAQVLAMDQGPE